MNDSAKQESKLGGHIRNRLLSVFSERIPVDRESVKRRLKEFSSLTGYRIKAVSYTHLFPSSKKNLHANRRGSTVSYIPVNQLKKLAAVLPR